MHPSAQMSVRLSVACPRACSGLMYGTRAHHRAGRGHRRKGRVAICLAVRGERLGQAEVQDLHPSLRV